MEAKEEAEQSPISCSPASPSSKKSGRRSMQKRVVSVPAGEVDGVRSKGGGETAPPSDSWAWRKYGQKPIKGSPYPRGYYRCSSSKGCPARKQVERSRADPTTFIVTYSSEHDHSWPFSRNNPQRHHESPSPSPADSATAGAATEPSSRTPEEENMYSSPTADQEDKLSDLMVENPAGLILPEDFHWFAEVSSPSTTSPTIGSDAELFCGPVLRVAEANVVLFDDCDKFTSSTADEEEDGLFAGLGELPECSIVFRRGFLEQQWRGDGDRKRYGIEAEESGTAATSWCGSTR